MDPDANAVDDEGGGEGGSQVEVDEENGSEPADEEQKEDHNTEPKEGPNGTVRKQIILTDEELAANLDRVKFTPAVTKQIISKHSGSILVKDEPIITLSQVMIENATRVFNEHVEPVEEEGKTEDRLDVDEEAKDALLSHKQSPRKSVSSDKLHNMMEQCGFHGSRVHNICDRMYNGPVNMELHDFIGFLTRFYAPSYYFGQRVRRFIGRGDMDQVFDLLARGCDVNSGDGEGLGLLHYASMFNRASAIEALISFAGNNIVVDAVDRYGWSPLHCACHHGNIDCVKQLLKAGANAKLADKNGKTPLHVAACQARNQVIDILLNYGEASELLNIQDNRGMTPVHDAAFKGHEKTFALLFNWSGVNANLKDILGNTCGDYITILDTNPSESKR